MMVMVRCNGVVRVRVRIPPEAVVLLSCQEATRRRGRNAPCYCRVTFNLLETPFDVRRVDCSCKE